jgi:antitoxin ParD1/3/4
MNVSIGEHWEKFIEQQVTSGRYASASEVVREGLRLVEQHKEYEKRRQELRDMLNASITAFGPYVTEEEMDASLEEVTRQLIAEGIPE